MSSQNVFITGASKGIGEGLVLEYAKRGHRLVICARSEDSLKGLSEKINSAGGECYYIVCDVTSRADVEKAVDFSLEKLGSIDIAILNAGIGEHNRFDNFDVESMEKTFRVNVFGLVYGLAYLIPLMKKQGSGKIAGISSLAETRGMPGAGPYCASKAAASHLLEAARIENQFENFNIITVKPGFIKTDLVKKNQYKMPFLMEVDKAVEIIIEGIEKNKSIIAFPLPMRIGSTLAKIFPDSLMKFMFRKS